MTVEYRVNSVTKWVITRLHSDGTSAGCETVAEFGDAVRADEIAQALSKAEGAQVTTPQPS